MKNEEGTYTWRAKIFVVFGYIFFLSFFFIFIQKSIHSETIEQCNGQAFNNRETFGTGSGKCEIRYNFYSTLLRLDEYDERIIYGTCEEYQGKWANGVREGQGSYDKFSIWNSFNHPPFEGEDKIEFTGLWKNNYPSGFGYFHVHVPERDAIFTWRGTWDKTNLTGKGDLEFEEHHPGKFYRSLKRFKLRTYPYTRTIYSGSLTRGLMDGIGSLSFDKNITLENAHFKQGLLVNSPNPIYFRFEKELSQTTETKQSVVKPIKSNLKNVEKILVEVDCYLNDIQYNGNSLSSANVKCDPEFQFQWKENSLHQVKVSSDPQTLFCVPLLEHYLKNFFIHLSAFQKTFLEYQKFIEEFKFSDFENAKKKSNK